MSVTSAWEVLQSNGKRQHPDSLISMAEPGSSHQLLSDILTRPNIEEQMGAIFHAVRETVDMDVLAVVRRTSSPGMCCLSVFSEGDGTTEQEVPITEPFSRWSWSESPIQTSSIELSHRIPAANSVILRQGIRSCFVHPLVVADEEAGFLILCSSDDHAFQSLDFTLIRSVATHVAVALERAEKVSEHAVLATEYHRLQTIQQVSEAVMSEIDRSRQIETVSSSMRDILGIEHVDLLLYDPEKGAMLWEGSGFLNTRVVPRAFHKSMLDTPSFIAYVHRGSAVYNKSQLEEAAADVPTIRPLLDAGVKEACSISLITHNKCLGFLNAFSSEENKFTPNCVSILTAITKAIAIAVDNALAYEEISKLKDTLTREKHYLRDEIATDRRFDEIIGESSALRNVLDQIETVADSDATVLILGETGTGKELIARALHTLNSRRDRPFIKINCAAIPSDLLESELFGHEKGAFTGASTAKIGLIELAHKGTLFLDEVGDLPLSLQPKLLRVLQERQLSRVGSTRTITVDFRLIAATNQNLLQMVASRQFRSELYYRLNVFPVSLPALRDRREDIPALVRHFVTTFANLRKRTIEFIPEEVMQALVQYDWPGNIRELENVIERAVILSKGRRLDVPATSLLSGPLEIQPAFHLAAPPRDETPLESEFAAENAKSRDRILLALKECRGIIAGPNGAATRLGMKRTTLLWRMQRLGIQTRREFS